MNAQYKQAVVDALEAGRAWQAAKLAYRCGFLPESLFALASELFKASREAFDAAYSEQTFKKAQD